MNEKFQPLAHTPPVGVIGSLKFYLRVLLDLQVSSVFSFLRRASKEVSGNILDVGCGQSPYAFLFDNKKTKYFGLDINHRDHFHYDAKHVTLFDGENIPFEDEKFDAVICTEVLEHAPHYQKLISEMHRVLKKGGHCYVTVPWSARFHYIPWDYFRYTPTSLKTMFQQFSFAEIDNRGTDFTSISAKIIVVFFRNIVPRKELKYFFALPFWIVFSPTLLFWIVLGHLSLKFNVGSADDPIGYNVFAKKD